MFNRLDYRIEVTLVSQIDQQLISVTDNYLFRKSRAGLSEIDTATKLVFRNRSAIRWANLKSNVSDLHLAMNNEAQTNRPGHLGRRQILPLARSLPVQNQTGIAERCEC